LGSPWLLGSISELWSAPSASHIRPGCAWGVHRVAILAR